MSKPLLFKTDEEEAKDDERFGRRGRLESSVFDHYEMTSNFTGFNPNTTYNAPTDECDSTDSDRDPYADYYPKKKKPLPQQPIDKYNMNSFFSPNVDTNTNINIPQSNTNISAPSQANVTNIDTYKINPDFANHYWWKYNRLTLNWDHCDGKCGSKLSKLIHNIIYGNKDDSNDSPSQDQKPKIDFMTETYCVGQEDTNAIHYFSSVDPSKVTQDVVFQMWSFFDSLRSRINEHSQMYADILNETKIKTAIQNDIKNSMNMSEIISKNFLSINSDLRKYLIDILEYTSNNEQKMDGNNDLISGEYNELLLFLKDKKNIILNEDNILKMYGYLTNFVKNQDYFILFLLSNRACYFRSSTLFQELERNNFGTINPCHYQKQIYQIMNKSEYIEMMKYGLELTMEEIVGILLYTGNNSQSQEIRDSFNTDNSNGCKWKVLSNLLISSVTKIQRILIQCLKRENLPNKLYYIVQQSKPKSVPFLNVVTTTSNLNIATSLVNQNETLFIFQNSNIMLQNGTLVGAPISWITSVNINNSKKKGNKIFNLFSKASSQNNNHEWLIVNVKIHESKRINQGKGCYKIDCFKYESISSYLLNRWFDTLCLKNNVTDIAKIGILTIYNKKEYFYCLNCNTKMGIYFYSGYLMNNNMECPCCRYINTFDFSVNDNQNNIINENRIVSCFGCNEQNKLKDYQLIKKDDKLHLKCNKCNQIQFEAFKNSKTHHYIMQEMCFSIQQQKQNENKKQNLNISQPNFSQQHQQQQQLQQQQHQQQPIGLVNDFGNMNVNPNYAPDYNQPMGYPVVNTGGGISSSKSNSKWFNWGKKKPNQLGSINEQW